MAAPLNQPTTPLVSPPTYKFIHSLLVFLLTRPLVNSSAC